MCLGMSKPVTYTAPDPEDTYVKGNVFDDKKSPFDNPEPSDINVGGDEPKKTKKPDTYNQGGIEGSNSGLNIT
nr:hypothetical protein MEP432_gp24 [Methylophilales phage MEP432]